MSLRPGILATQTPARVQPLYPIAFQSPSSRLIVPDAETTTSDDRFGSVTVTQFSTGTVTGTAGRFGSATATTTSTGTATGIAGRQGSISATSTSTGTATGTAARYGSVSGVTVSSGIVGAGTGTGTPPPPPAPVFTSGGRGHAAHAYIQPRVDFEDPRVQVEHHYGSVHGITVSSGIVGAGRKGLSLAARRRQEEEILILLEPIIRERFDVFV